MVVPYKRYQCNLWPEYRIRDLKFSEGILTVYSQRDADLVEGVDNYGTLIWEIQLEEQAVPVKTEVARQGTQATMPTENQQVEAEVEEEPEPEPEPELIWPQDEVKVLGGGYYEYQGKKVRGKKNLPEEAQELV